MELTHKFAKNLKKGDLIGIAISNRITPGIFIKQTDVSIQYLRISLYTLNILEKKITPRISYITGSNLATRIAHLNKESTDNNILTIYNRIKNLI